MRAHRDRPPDDPEDGPASDRRHGPRHQVLGVGVAVLVVVLSVPAWSFGRALTAPGNDPLSAKAVEWVRDHGGNGLVNRIENYWYRHHPPPTGGAPAHGLPHPHAATVPATTATAPPSTVAPDPPPAPIAPIAASPLPGEGRWTPVGRVVAGRAAIYETFLRPDPVHTSLVTGVAWIDSRRVRAVYHNGLQVPGGGPWQEGPMVAPADQPSLVAAFNSGFKLDASRGGYYAEGRTVATLVPGRASLVVRRDGSVDVGTWGRDLKMGPDVAAVRQNLDLLVDGGRLAPDLTSNVTAKWGATVGNQVYVWRSGLGVDRNGNLLYVAGDGLDVATLAHVLQDAGAVRAMELDINSLWTSFYSYLGGGAAGPVVGTKLLPNMRRPPTRYLEPGSRDFVALQADPARLTGP